MGGRSADRDYARFLEATLGLADVAGSLPRRARFGLATAILRACESDRDARTALAAHELQHLERAAAAVSRAREGLAEVAADQRRRRALSLVA